MISAQKYVYSLFNYGIPISRQNHCKSNNNKILASEMINILFSFSNFLTWKGGKKEEYDSVKKGKKKKKKKREYYQLLHITYTLQCNLVSSTNLCIHFFPFNGSSWKKATKRPLWLCQHKNSHINTKPKIITLPLSYENRRKKHQKRHQSKW